MNLLTEIKKGQEGLRIGATTGSPVLDKMTLGIRPGTSIAIAAKEKVGKSKFVRWHYIVQPYLKEVLAKNTEIRWILFTLEEPRFKVEADITCALIYEIYGKEITRSKLLGEDIDDEGAPIKLTFDELSLIERVYKEHILVLFGEYDEDGHQLRPGLIETHESDITPSKFESILLEFAKFYGELETKKVVRNVRNKLVESEEIVSFKKNFDVLPIVIVDDYRLFTEEPGYKETKSIIDETIRVQVMMTQRIKFFAFIGIIHLGRESTDYERIKAVGTMYYFPEARHVMDSSVPAQRAHTVITLLNPSDTGFPIKVHFNEKVKPNMRGIHLVASRDTPFPQHAHCDFDGGVCSWSDYRLLSF